MEGLNEYMDKIIDFLSAEKEQPLSILIAGGMVDARKVVECESFAIELRQRLDANNVRHEIQTDPGPLTSDDIVQAAELRALVRGDDVVVHLCDRTRRRVVAWYCSETHKGTRVRYVVHGFKRRDITLRSTLAFQELKLLLSRFGKMRSKIRNFARSTRR